jgi:hypothetical protein
MLLQLRLVLLLLRVDLLAIRLPEEYLCPLCWCLQRLLLLLLLL